MSFTISAYICAYNYVEAIIYNSLACKDENWKTHRSQNQFRILSPLQKNAENEPISYYKYPLFQNFQYLQIYIYQAWAIYQKIMGCFIYIQDSSNSSSFTNLVSWLLPLEATEPVSEPLLEMAVELINIHLISVQWKRLLV